MVEFRFFGQQAIRDLAGKFRRLEYDSALEFIIAAEAERRRRQLYDATPKRTTNAARSWKVGNIGKGSVRVYTTDPKTINDLLNGTTGPIVPKSKNLLQWRETRIGYAPGVYFRRLSVQGQRPNSALNLAVDRVKREAFDSAVEATYISEATRAARL